MENQELEIERVIDETGDRYVGIVIRSLKSIYGEDSNFEQARRVVLNAFGNMGFRSEIKLIVKNIINQTNELTTKEKRRSP